MQATLALVAAVCVAASCARAQNTTGRVWDFNNNGWYMYFGDHQVRDKWGVHLEGQWRRNDVITNWQQLLLRPGVNYQMKENWMLTLGYAYVKTHPYGEHPIAHAFPEHRLYQQLLVKQRVGATRLQHRFRLEQRFEPDEHRRRRTAQAGFLAISKPIPSFPESRSANWPEERGKPLVRCIL